MLEEPHIKSTTMTPPLVHKKLTMQLQMNSIIGRRTPQNLGSTPLLQFPNKITEKSKFSQQRESSNSPLWINLNQRLILNLWPSSYSSSNL